MPDGMAGDLTIRLNLYVEEARKRFRMVRNEVKKFQTGVRLAGKSLHDFGLRTDVTSKGMFVAGRQTGLALRQFKALGPQLYAAGEAFRSLGRNMFYVIVQAGFLMMYLRGVVKDAITFESEMSRVATMLGEKGRRWTEIYRKGIRALAKEMGIGTKELTASLYDTLSATIEASKAMKVVQAAAMFAVGGFMRVDEATKMLLTTLRAFHYSTDQTLEVTDMLWGACERGRFTLGELSGSFGKVAATCAQVGLSLVDTLAMIAATTRATGEMEIATVGLTNVTKVFMAPTVDARKGLLALRRAHEDLNLQLSTEWLRREKLVGFIREMAKLTASERAQIFKNVRAIRMINALMAEQAEIGTDVNVISSQSGRTLRELGHRLEDTEVVLKRIVEAGKAMLEEYVRPSMPALEGLVNYMGRLFGILEKMPGPVRVVAGNFGVLGVTFGFLAMAGTIFTTAMVKSSTELFKIVKDIIPKTITAFKSMRIAIVEARLAFIALRTIGVAALVYAFITVMRKGYEVKQMFERVTKAAGIEDEWIRKLEGTFGQLDLREKQHIARVRELEPLSKGEIRSIIAANRGIIQRIRGETDLNYAYKCLSDTAKLTILEYWGEEKALQALGKGETTRLKGIKKGMDAERKLSDALIRTTKASKEQRESLLKLEMGTATLREEKEHLQKEYEDWVKVLKNTKLGAEDEEDVIKKVGEAYQKLTTFVDKTRKTELAMVEELGPAFEGYKEARFKAIDEEIERLRKLGHTEEILNALRLKRIQDVLDEIAKFREKDLTAEEKRLEELRAMTSAQLIHMLGDFIRYTEDKDRIRQVFEEREQAGLLGVNEAFRASWAYTVRYFDSNAMLIMKTAGDVAERMRSGFSDTTLEIISQTGNMRDVLRSMFSDIGRAFRRLLADMVAQAIMRTKVMQAITAWLFPIPTPTPTGGGAGGGAGATGGWSRGGILPGHFASIQQMQAGGIYTRPTLGLIGEQYRPEAVIPLQRGAVPVELRGGASQVDVSINVYAIDAATGIDYIRRPEVKSAIRQDIIDQLDLGGVFRSGVRRRM